ncbi:unnamed protein product [Bursaphelenchus okinawaensis]|uniref:Peptidase C1A papain C-terminal domain-containing protein n=1 Tax=Bursaphelenchus okinawaensis TaxID=465554 RepID=A0A811LR47_9BILA|nr:unnamed protein product [Bursaphelenchus okinawaensis]CAG9127530.1 unnamed protein product [Bursaphelenchus okinawaensis]
MPSDSEVIISDDFGDSQSPTTTPVYTQVRHKVHKPHSHVTAAREFVKRQKLCQRTPMAVFKVSVLGLTLLLIIIMCVIYQTWLNTPSTNHRPHSRDDEEYHLKLVNYINNPAHQTEWKAEYNKFAARGMDEEEDTPNEKNKEKDNEIFNIFKNNKYAVFGDTLSYLPRLVARRDVKIPKSFDIRLKWPLCSSVHRIQNQGSCGSCWAASATSAIADRICIQSNYTQQPQISIKDLLMCCPHCGTCGGATWPLFAFTYWKTDGIVTGGQYGSYEGCKPYEKSASCGNPCPTDYYTNQIDDKFCERKCQPLYSKTYEEDLLHAREAYWIKPIPNADEYFPDYMKRVRAIVGDLDYVTLIKREVYLNGPVMSCFPVYDEFQHYKGGIYNKTSPDAKMLYGHCAKLIGWGEENGIEYWTYANTWGRDWGENGFFRMRLENLPEEVAAGNI